MPDFRNISKEYEGEPQNFMISTRKPSTVIIRCIDYENERYSIDSDPGLFKYKNLILIEMGKVAERFLTLEKQDFLDAFYGDRPDLIEDDYHRFMKMNDNICMRS